MISRILRIRRGMRASGGMQYRATAADLKTIAESHQRCKLNSTHSKLLTNSISFDLRHRSVSRGILTIGTG
jgi:hypothetical protein